MANGYISYHDDDDYANIYYGSKARPYAGRYQQQHYYPTNTAYSHYTNVSYQREGENCGEKPIILNKVRFGHKEDLIDSNQ